MQLIIRTSACAAIIGALLSNQQVASGARKTTRPSKVAKPIKKSTKTSSTTSTIVPTPTTSLVSIPVTVPKPAEWLGVGMTRPVATNSRLTRDGKWLVAEGNTLQSLADGRTVSIADELPSPLSVRGVSFNGDASLVAITTDSGLQGEEQSRVVLFNRVAKTLTPIGPYGAVRLSDDGSALFFSGGTIQFGRRGTLETFAVQLPNGSPERISVGTNNESMLQRPLITDISANGKRVLFENQLTFTEPLGALVRDVPSKTTTNIILLQHSSRYFKTPKAISGDGETVAVSMPDQPDLAYSSTWLLPVTPGPERVIRDATGSVAQVVYRGGPVLSNDGRSGLFVSARMIPVDPKPTSPDALTSYPRGENVQYFDGTQTIVVPVDLSLFGNDFELTTLNASADLSVFVVCGNRIVRDPQSTSTTTSTVVLLR
jgi:hypothetical protein